MSGERDRLCQHGEGIHWIQLSLCGICLQAERSWGMLIMPNGDQI